MVKGDAGRPIWIAITFLLALLVGVSMYQLLSKTASSGSFDKWLSSISATQADEQVISFCKSWYDASFPKYPTNLDKWVRATYAASHPDLPMRYLTEAQVEECNPDLETLNSAPNAYDANGAEGCLQICDCIVILYKASTENTGTSYLTKYQAQKLFDKYNCEIFFNERADRPTALLAESLGLME